MKFTTTVLALAALASLSSSSPVAVPASKRAITPQGGVVYEIGHRPRPPVSRPNHRSRDLSLPTRPRRRQIEYEGSMTDSPDGGVDIAGALVFESPSTNATNSTATESIGVDGNIQLDGYGGVDVEGNVTIANTTVAFEGDVEADGFGGAIVDGVIDVDGQEVELDGDVESDGEGGVVFEGDVEVGDVWVEVDADFGR